MRSPYRPSPSASPARFTPPSSPMRHTFSESLIEENIENAEILITKWDPDSSSYAKITSLFYENRYEAKQFLNRVKDLQNAMHFYVKENPNSYALVRAQNLMQIAMKRLQKEFYQILAVNRQHLDAESVSSRSSLASARSSLSVSDDGDDSEDDELKISGENTDEITSAASESDRILTTVMGDLKAIADCMISSGYGKECVKIYRIVRKSVVDEGLYSLGLDRTLSTSEITKMEWEVLEGKIKTWLHAVKVSVKTLFYGERILCDYVFASSLPIRESLFNEVTRDGALALFGFAESVAKCKKSSEKLFRILDLYEAIANLWSEIDFIFSNESNSAVRTQAVNALVKLGEAVRMILTDFEISIRKDNSKSAVAGGGIHPITRYVMNYLTFLADYTNILPDIIGEWKSDVNHPLPDSFVISDDSATSVVSRRLAWLIMLVLCKLDGKSDLCKDVALSYLFLANNLDYVVHKVRHSNLKYLLGEGWIAQHESKVKQYMANYEKMGWHKVLSSLPDEQSAEMISINEAKETLKRFNIAFEEAYKRQTDWVVSDRKLREEIKVSLAKKLLPRYTSVYEKHGAALRRDAYRESIVRFTPEDLGNYLSDLFYGTGGSGSVSSAHSSSSGSNSGRSHHKCRKQ